MSSNRRGSAGLGMGKESYQQGFGGLGRTVKMFFGFFPKLAPIAFICIIVSAGIGAIPSIFTQNIIKIIEKWVESGDYEAAKPKFQASTASFFFHAVMMALELLTIPPFPSAVNPATAASAPAPCAP